MNMQESDILNVVAKEKYINQRMISEISGHSLGVVNKSIKSLLEKDYLDEEMQPTQKAQIKLKHNAPRNAVILAAGFGMRMVPINTEIPKGLLEVKGEPLIERFIKQLNEIGIKEIYVVVGFMKEQYEYLIDAFGVELIVNPEYALKNNLYSMKCVLDKLGNTYVVPCDIWCEQNPFRKNELYSWYMVSKQTCQDSNVRVNRKLELTITNDSEDGNTMLGISYLLQKEADIVRKRIRELCDNSRFNGDFWEKSLYHNRKMILNARVVSLKEVIEIDTYEQLREIDSDSSQLKTDAISTIMDALNVGYNDIADITILKKGMTNRSFLFSCRKKKYIMRIPGEGTSQLINRAQESDVYHAIKGLDICDEIAYINSDNGYKITEFIEDARGCDPFKREDVERCMKKLRSFHALKLKVKHEFQIFEHIEFYESLWGGNSSVYKDYQTTKENVFSLKGYIDEYASDKVLTHIDAVPDNFLIVPGEEVRLIDWEYAGMQDPHVDVAMFCIYSLYNKSQVDQLIQIYFEENCSREVQIKIYCYIAVCGLLWSNWCEYKKNLGIDFGGYSLKQYRFAKDYYRIVQHEQEKEKETNV